MLAVHWERSWAGSWASSWAARSALPWAHSEEEVAARPSAGDLLSRSGEDEGFARRHAAFLRGALRSTDLGLGPELLKHLERLTFKASEEKVVRLAQLLVELRDRLQGGTQERARQLLDDWKNRSAALKLKIYHLEQGIP